MVRHRINKTKLAHWSEPPIWDLDQYRGFTLHLEILGAIFYYMYVSFLLRSRNALRNPKLSG